MTTSGCSWGREEHLPVSKFKDTFKVWGSTPLFCQLLHAVQHSRNDIQQTKPYPPPYWGWPPVSSKRILPIGRPLDSPLHVQQLVQYCQLWELSTSSMQVNLSNSWTLFLLFQHYLSTILARSPRDDFAVARSSHLLWCSLGCAVFAAAMSQTSLNFYSDMNSWLFCIAMQMSRRNQSPGICIVEVDPRSISSPPTAGDNKQDLSESMGNSQKNRSGGTHSGPSLDRI